MAMRLFPRSACLLACLLLAACAIAHAGDAGPVFVVVRHAEKTGGETRDPALTAAGESRAASLARRLRDEPLVAVYTTPLRRTRQTAQPTAQAHDLAVNDYDAKLPAGELAARLRRDHAAGTVLVVGHSNTVPGIVGALCNCAVAPLDESEYGDLYRVRFAADAPPELVRERF